MIRAIRTTPLAVGLVALAALPKCSCETEPGVQRASVEMDLTFVEVDACSGAAIPRRIPDDLNGRTTTDLGSRADRVFELRSRGVVPLRVSEISLSAEDPGVRQPSVRRPLDAPS